MNNTIYILTPGYFKHNLLICNICNHGIIGQNQSGCMRITIGYNSINAEFFCFFDNRNLQNTSP